MICKKVFCKEFVGHRSKIGLCYKHRGFPPTKNYNLYDKCKCGKEKIKTVYLCEQCLK